MLFALVVVAAVPRTLHRSWGLRHKLAANCNSSADPARKTMAHRGPQASPWPTNDDDERPAKLRPNLYGDKLENFSALVVAGPIFACLLQHYLAQWIS